MYTRKVAYIKLNYVNHNIYIRIIVKRIDRSILLANSSQLIADQGGQQRARGLVALAINHNKTSQCIAYSSA